MSNNNVLITGNLTVQGDSFGFPTYIKTATLSDVKPNGTGGGSASSGLNNRTLNTLVDPDNIITLDSGNVLFSFNEPGTYFVSASAPKYTGNLTKIFLTDSGNAVVINGMSSVTTSASPDGAVRAYLSGILPITNTSTQYKVMQYVETAGTGLALGVSDSTGENEVYTQLIVMKL